MYLNELVFVPVHFHRYKTHISCNMSIWSIFYLSSDLHHTHKTRVIDRWNVILNMCQTLYHFLIFFDLLCWSVFQSIVRYLMYVWDDIVSPICCDFKSLIYLCITYTPKMCTHDVLIDIHHTQKKIAFRFIMFALNLNASNFDLNFDIYFNILRLW